MNLQYNCKVQTVIATNQHLLMLKCYHFISQMSIKLQSRHFTFCKGEEGLTLLIFHIIYKILEFIFKLLFII